MKTLAPFSRNYYHRDASPSVGNFALRYQMVALGRALGIGTKCLLLDEPFEGIAPVLSERLSEVLASRSEERRVGKEWKYRWWEGHWKKIEQMTMSRRRLCKHCSTPCRPRAAD